MGKGAIAGLEGAAHGGGGESGGGAGLSGASLLRAGGAGCAATGVAPNAPTTTTTVRGEGTDRVTMMASCERKREVDWLGDLFGVGDLFCLCLGDNDLDPILY